ncbi:MAG: UDP-N-acetylglucosamine--N-acetylmuramyl-(pentapeptide) pyrophosphoryl-undecaprenol N-acetylglucosamine transferase [Phycisphaerae bacterium]
MMNRVESPSETERRSRPGVHGIIFAGGGTGGHIFPGIAIAESLQSMHGDRADCCFAVSDRPLDAEILRVAGRQFVVIPAAPFSARPRKLLRFVGRWGRAVRTARELIRGMKASCGGGVDVLAMGGFVAAPVVQAARVEKVPVTLVNLDAAPGLANRWIARRAARVCSAMEVEAGQLGTGRVQMVPPIVRRAARAAGTAAECRRMLGLDPNRPTLLVTGASQGARSINAFVAQFAAGRAGLLQQAGWQVIHQTGKGEAAAAEQAYAAAGVPAVVREFIDEMGVAWGAADVAVTRCGAGSVAEAWANAVPSLMMPYPYHKDQHQKKNAQVLVQAGAAVVCDDLIEPGANDRAVGTVLERLMRDPQERERMRRAFGVLGPADGADRIAKLVSGSWR